MKIETGDYIFVYITAPSHDSARDISRALVEERLVACANILPQVTSICRWEGKIEQQQEVVVVLKTKGSLYDKVQARICALHPYQCPCIVGLPIDHGLEGFLNWIETETRQTPPQ